MAAKKPAGQEPVEVPAVTPEMINPWKVMVEIKLAKGPKGEPNYEIVSVNGRVFKIKKGERVQVPLPIAEVIEHSLEAQDAADAYIESVISEDD